MRDSAQPLAASEARSFDPNVSKSLQEKIRHLDFEPRAQQSAAVQMGRLAADMLVYDRIAPGACLH